MNRKIFREKALEKLASPESISELIEVTSSRSWLALFALGALCLAFITWSIWGSLPKTARGQGILIQSGGIAEITSLASGIIEDIRVKEGQHIQKDDTIAIISQPELELQIKNAQAKLNELVYSKTDPLEINDLKRNIEELKNKFAISSYIISPFKGKVIEMMTKNGRLVSLGSEVASLEIENNQKSELEAIMYVAPDEGKRIKNGMQVRIAPSTIRIEEYGYILGVVTKVSEYPSTRQGMISVLGNASLVETFFKNEPPIAVSVSLKKSKTFSGFQWTSVQGPKIEIQSGTLCDAFIMIQHQSPLSLLLPFLREGN